MKELKFIHISKTGGSSIEEVGKSKNILWGRHDPIYKDLGSGHRDYFHEPIKKN